MFFLQFISKLIKVLRSGESPRLIAGGFAMGFVVGMTPLMTLQNVLIILTAILTRVNLASVFFAMFLFSFVAYIFDPIFHDVGFFLLAQIENIRPLWTIVYNWPIAPFTRFYNTVVMGSFSVALLLTYPVFLLAQKGIVAYRKSWGDKLDNSKFAKAIKGSSLFKWYIKIRDLGW